MDIVSGLIVKEETGALRLPHLEAFMSKDNHLCILSRYIQCKERVHVDVNDLEGKYQFFEARVWVTMDVNLGVGAVQLVFPFY